MKRDVIETAGSRRAGEFKEIERDLIRPVNNPRKIFNEDALKELAASIQEVGIKQPLLVRYQPQLYTLHEPDLLTEGKEWVVLDRAGKEVFRDVNQNAVRLFCGGHTNLEPFYELVAGERRWRAAGMIGLEKVPCMVEELTDEEVTAIRLIENEQRQDLTDLEKADGYKAAIDSKQFTAESLAKKLGKSRSHVFSMLALLRLQPAVRDALTAGKIEKSVANLLATIPDPAKQEELLKTISDEERWQYPFSFRKVQEIVENKYTAALGDAPFELKDAKLHREAGSCKDCPLRSGNMMESFPHIKNPYVCTQPACFQEKCSRHWAKVKAEAEERGQKVLTLEEFRSGEYTELDEECYDAPETPKYRDLLGKHLPKLPALATTHDGRLVEVIATEELDNLIEKNKLIPERPKDESGVDWEKQRREQQKKVEHNSKVAASAVTAMQGMASELGGLHFLRNLVVMVANQNTWSGRKVFIRAPEIKKLASGSNEAAILRDYAWNHCNDETSLRALLVLMLATMDVDYRGEFHEAFTANCNLFAVDLKQIEEVLDKPKPKPEKKTVSPHSTHNPFRKPKKTGDLFGVDLNHRPFPHPEPKKKAKPKPAAKAKVKKVKAAKPAKKKGKK